MKLALSTLTCGKWGLSEILEHSEGIDAIDFRGLAGEMKLWETPEFRLDRVAATLARIHGAGLTVSGISTSVRIDQTDPPGEDRWAPEVQRSVALAKMCGAGHIRVFAGNKAAGPPDSAERRVIVDQYRRICESVSDAGVSVLAETHDVCAGSSVLAEIVSLVEHPLAGIIWDIRHPFQKASESYEQTANVLKPFLKLVHVKDFSADGEELVQFGTGHLRPDHLAQLLEACGYDGFLTLEQPRVDATGRPEPALNIRGFVETFGKYR